MRFENGEFYHVYNRSFNKTRIFFNQENYNYFLRKLYSLTPICDIIAYCLMPDHFHLLIYVPENSEGTRQTAQSGQTGIQLISRKLGTILSSYTQGINKQKKRSGSLFQPKAKAKKLYRERDLFNCFHYIHQNPHKARLVNKIEDWIFSSFSEYRDRKLGICRTDLAYEFLEIPKERDQFLKQSYQIIEYLDVTE